MQVYLRLQEVLDKIGLPPMILNSIKTIFIVLRLQSETSTALGATHTRNCFILRET